MTGKTTFFILLIILPFVAHTTGLNKNQSALATGKWYKLAVTQTGIYRISYPNLIAMGIAPDTIDVAKIRLFGNGSGMLSEANSAPRIDDLREISIQVVDGGDGHFDAADYILFYGESADKWTYEKLTRFFGHQRNLYSDSTFYFLNFGQSAGRRVQVYPYLNVTPTNFSTRFDDPISHELDQLNLIRSGREWYGEVFDNTTSSYTIPFSFPNIDNTTPVKIRTAVAGRCSLPSYFFLSQNGVKIDSLKIDSTNPLETTIMGRPKTKLTSIPNPGSDQILTLSYNLPSSGAIGWLNYIDVTASRHLVYTGPQMSFRDVNSVGQGKMTEFSLSQSNPAVRIWDVSNPSAILDLQTVMASGAQKFNKATDSLKEFIAFDQSLFLEVKFSGEVPNQNLHSCQPTTMVIVTHPLFMQQAMQLASLHNQGSNMSVQIVKVNEIFNEFSCGQPDPTAIRDFVRMLYDRGTAATKPKYLLLFGDGSYDPKNRVPGNNNLIPTFQSVESLNATSSYVTDDFFGVMALNSGQEANGTLDIGIGRFPVSTVAEAQAMVDKIIHYSATNYPVRSDWRNVVTFLADDEDKNLHMQQAEEMVAIVGESYPTYNINKIYFDAYKMIEIPGGQRFPDANRAVNEAVSKGSLIVNYTGHGGEAGWSKEQVITTADILSWKNADKLPVFVTATCEFSRFDNPERYTAGEMLINQPGGGAIALYSTTRLAYAGYNIQLNKSFFEHLMDKTEEGQYIKMGDLIRLSKNDNKNNYQLRNFVLLGDPAQSIAFADYVVKTKSINGKNANYPDTASGLSTVVVNGQIEDAAGQKVTSFNGVISCKVFDKPVTYSTLGNRSRDGDNFPEPFKIENSLLFSGDVPVTAGEFWITFTMPKGISLQFGNGKISYYAYNDTYDASGYSDMIVIGGQDPSVDPGNEGPEIGMFLNDRTFISGGQTTASPVLIADFADTNGINWLGLGIGHEIEAVLDYDRAHAIVLNDYYQQTFNSSTRGSLEFLLPELTQGKHTLSLKAWDMFDNSSEKVISFYIPGTPSLNVTNVKTAPNPMSESTRFLFQPNTYLTEDLDIIIRIYNLQGKLVTTLNSTWSTTPTDLPAISWDGTDASGTKLKNGLYPYKMIFSGKTGSYHETSQKLMIIR
ncbi:MAG: type IX secretion system sortase PorU [Bacteroidetes bacterium]|nr:type IX secretion system sortase PorU [Bacteroidota bacterium]